MEGLPEPEQEATMTAGASLYTIARGALLTAACTEVEPLYSRRITAIDFFPNVGYVHLLATTQDRSRRTGLIRPLWAYPYRGVRE